MRRLNEATREKGLAELESFQLITIDSAVVKRDPLLMQRRRNIYTVHLGNLQTNPEDLEARSATTTTTSSEAMLAARLRRLGALPVAR